MYILILKKRQLYMGGAILGVLILLGLFFWFQNRERPASSIQLKYSYQRLLPDEAYSMMENNTEVVVLDLRPSKEYEQGHIVGAHSVSYRALKSQLDQLDRNVAYILYCANGKESYKASKLMAEAGFPRVYTITGGYAEWPYDITKKP